VPKLSSPLVAVEVIVAALVVAVSFRPYCRSSVIAEGSGGTGGAESEGTKARP
jgi:hypothetical protein